MTSSLETSVRMTGRFRYWVNISRNRFFILLLYWSINLPDFLWFLAPNRALKSVVETKSSLKCLLLAGGSIYFLVTQFMWTRFVDYWCMYFSMTKRDWVTVDSFYLTFSGPDANCQNAWWTFLETGKIKSSNELASFCSNRLEFKPAEIDYAKG